MFDGLETIFHAAPTFLETAGRQALYAAILALVVSIAAIALRRRSPLLHLALWSLVLARLVLPADLAVPYSARDLLDRADLVATVIEPATPPATTGTTGPASPEAVAAGAAAATPPLDRLRDAMSWQVALVGLWLLGALGFLALFLSRRRAFRRLIARSEPLLDPDLLTCQHDWIRRLGIRRPVRVVTSAESRTPFTMGVVWPVIYLPKEILALDDRNIVESVLAHELAHVARFDDALLTLCRLLECLYFFHPAAWIAGRKINDACEHLSDGLVVAHGADVRTYGRSLLAILEMNLPPARTTVAMRTSKRWHMRIRNLLATETIPRTRTLPVLAATLLVGIFLLPMAGAEPSVETPRTTANATETARGFVIVVHEGDPATSISPEHLRTLYLKRGPAQSRINEPIDLIETSPTREAFSRVILDQEVEDVTSYWERMAFSGRGVPPLEKGNEAEVLDLVYENPGYIGYVSPATPLPPGIKILSID